MKHEVRIPSVGESITEAYLGKWRKQPGDIVKPGEVLLEIETQKTNFDLEAEYHGRLEILHFQEGEKLPMGTVIAMIDDSMQANPQTSSPALSVKTMSTPAAAIPLSPAVRRLVADQGIDAATISGSGKGGRLTKNDLLNPPPPAAVPTISKPSEPMASPPTRFPERGEREEKASRIRVQIAENLVRAQHTAAILTTFNEVDMSQVVQGRERHKEKFQARHDVTLGFVGFFALAAAQALKTYPLVNAVFTGDHIIHRDYVDISVAISTDRGLVVPVLRDVDKMDLVAFEKAMAGLTAKAQAGKLSIPEMTGGTFTISNGGVFGSLLSTPILNMPQSAILGLHKTEKRPVVVGDQIVIRPMMYVALSYDHRVIDGKDAVQFLVAIKENIENLHQIVSWEKIA